MNRHRDHAADGVAQGLSHRWHTAIKARLILLGLGGVGTLALAACGRDDVGPVEERQEQLLFLSTRSGGTDPLGRPLQDIYRMNADGSGVVNVTQQPAWGFWHLDLSPDGQRLAYISSNDCNIRVTPVYGGQPTKLTNLDGGTQDGCNGWPRWSADGSRIAFTSNRERRTYQGAGYYYDAYVMNADGSDAHNVSRSLGDDLGGYDVAVLGWSPSGQVAFETERLAGGTWSRVVYLVNADGTGVRPLFERPGDHSPAWSPDGSKVAFISERDGRPRLYLMNSDGSGERPLTSHDGDDRLPGKHGGTEAAIAYDPWSPDGKRIAFDYDAVNAWGTYIINADGTDLRRLSYHPTFFNGWSWSGARIAYTDRGIPNDLYVVHGTSIVNVTASPFDDGDAIWLPAR